jgi:hypothetical protein
MRLDYDTMKRTYDEYNDHSTDELYRELGWSDLIGNPSWVNTCAIRMSLALIACGVSIPGRIRIRAGRYAGRSVEPGQNRLSDWLLRTVQPRAQSFRNHGSTLPPAMTGRRGIVSFMRIPSYAGGHIDLVESREDWVACSRSCYFDSVEVRFWDLGVVARVAA